MLTMHVTKQPLAFGHVRPALAYLGDNLRAKATAIVLGLEKQKSILGLIRPADRVLTVRERIDWADQIAELARSGAGKLVELLELRQRFCLDLGRTLRALVTEKTQEIREVDRKRIALSELARTSGDTELASRTMTIEERNVRAVAALADAAAAMGRRLN